MNKRYSTSVLATAVCSTALFVTGAAQAFSDNPTANQNATPQPNSNMWSWGENLNGELGKGHSNGTGNMVPANVLSNIVQASASGVSGAALTADGTLLTWGSNVYGQLGNGTNTTNYTPTAVASAGNAFTTVSVGGDFMLALDYAGGVYSWGNNSNGQLGNSTVTSSSTPIHAQYAGGTQLTGFIDVSAGYDFALALRSDGTIWAWGRGTEGQLGNNGTTNQSSPVQVATLNSIKAISTGYGHALALRTDGKVWAWGSNNNGQLGFTGANSPVAVQVTLPLPARAISAGEGDSTVILSDGTIRGWGDNVVGQLGNGTTTSSSSPITPSVGTAKAIGISSPAQSSIAVMSDGSVRTWGYNSYGQIGDGTTVNRSTPVTPAVSGVSSVMGGYAANFALAPSGLVSAWGYNADGELGNGLTSATSTPASIAGLTTVKSVAVGCFHSVAVLANGTVKSWGYNSNGQLGDGTTTSRTAPVTVPGLSGIVAVGAGCFHSLAVKADGTVYSWGQNTYGQLGNATTTDSHAPVVVTGISKAIAAAGGDGHSLVLLADGSMQAFGSNLQGQLGIAGTAGGTSTSPAAVTLTNVKQIAAGYAHSYAIFADGTVRTWGDNTYGELGVGDTATHAGIQTVPSVTGVRSIAGGSSNFHTVALTALGVPTLWGNNAYGQLGNYPTTYSTAVTSPTTMTFVGGLTRTIGAGYLNTFITAAASTLYTVGDNSNGELGSGSTTPPNTNMITQASGLTKVTAGFGGAYFSVAMTH